MKSQYAVLSHRSDKANWQNEVPFQEQSKREIIFPFESIIFKTCVNIRNYLCNYDNILYLLTNELIDNFTPKYPCMIDPRPSFSKRIVIIPFIFSIEKPICFFISVISSTKLGYLGYPTKPGSFSRPVKMRNNLFIESYDIETCKY